VALRTAYDDVAQRFWGDGRGNPARCIGRGGARKGPADRGIRQAGARKRLAQQDRVQGGFDLDVDAVAMLARGAKKRIRMTNR
jgi:hypothetical protein